ncbi:hypothetical protein D9615_007178 [Tricholomella constricta]|uniref:Uncharacterized protein n=1 Tax=Tricholomella constricta TaxID=117010 RepID=A0A8H5H8R1_9AGAR|nr:hypothetical protein D9615_007178 [Tricholomella constricta]
MAFMKAPPATASPSDPFTTQFRSFSQTAEAAMHAPRADSFTASPTTSSSSTSTTNRPFFQDPSSVTPVPTPDGPGVSHSLAKSVLEYAILSVGVVLVGCLLLNRYTRLKRNNQPLSRFFSRTSPASSSSSTTAHLSSAQPSRFPRTTGLFDVPPYPYAHRTRAHDTDVAGRRLGGPLNSDHDGYIGDKDVLPAYEHAGGPPKYGELEMMPIRSPIPALSPTVGGAGRDGGGTGAEEVLAQAPSDNAAAALARPEPDPDIERGDAVPTPAPVHVRG